MKTRYIVFAPMLVAAFVLAVMTRSYAPKQDSDITKENNQSTFSDELIRQAQSNPGVPVEGEGFSWVRVENLEGIDNGNRHFNRGDDCQVINRSLTDFRFILGGKAGKLIRYDGPNGYGSQCAAGTMFLNPAQ